MSKPEQALTPLELAQRIAYETVHLPVDQRILAWPPVLRAMSIEGDQIRDFIPSDREACPGNVIPQVRGVLNCAPDGSTPQFLAYEDTLVDMDMCNQRGLIPFMLNEPVYSELTHLDRANVVTDLEVEGDPLSGEGRITAFHAIERPRRRFTPGDAEGYIRGRVQSVERQERDKGGCDAISALVSIDPDSMALVNLISGKGRIRGDGLLYTSHRLTGKEAMPLEGDILTATTIFYDGAKDALSALGLSLLYRPER